MNQALSLTNSITYLRGKFVPFADANVSIASSPVLYGLTIYTVFSVNWNEETQQLYAFRLRDHYDRLAKSARIMDFEDFQARYSYDEFEQIMLELLHKNSVREDALVRVMIYIDEISAGTKIRGLDNDLTAYVYPMGEILPRDGAHTCVSSWQRTGDNMIPSRAKINGSYINASLMKNEALANGFDEAIALDVHGHVAEGTVANIFLVRNGVLLTPDSSTDILEGITRRTILEIAAAKNMPIMERSIDRSELYASDEAMFVGSSARITPIISIDRRPVGDGKPGAITKRLASYYHDLQHGKLKTDLLTPVYQNAEVTAD